MSISTVGATAGAIASAITFIAVSSTGSVSTQLSGITIRIVGKLVASATTFLVGEVIGNQVINATILFASQAETSLQKASNITAFVSACTIGITTAIVFTMSDFLIRKAINGGIRISKALYATIQELLEASLSKKLSLTFLDDFFMLEDDDIAIIDHT